MDMRPASDPPLATLRVGEGAGALFSGGGVKGFSRPLVACRQPVENSWETKKFFNFNRLEFSQVWVISIDKGLKVAGGRLVASVL